MMVGEQFGGTGQPGQTAWEGLVSEVVGASGLELVKAELKGRGSGRLLRVYIDCPVDQPEGVGLADCERVSRALSAALDEAMTQGREAVLAGSYTLEVSSPGVDRPLVKLSDFERFAGQRAEVRTREPIAGSRRFVGTLLAFDSGDERIRLQPEQGPEVGLAWSNVADARLAPRWPTPAGAGKPPRKKKAGRKRK